MYRRVRLAWLIATLQFPERVTITINHQISKHVSKGLIIKRSFAREFSGKSQHPLSGWRHLPYLLCIFPRVPEIGVGAHMATRPLDTEWPTCSQFLNKRTLDIHGFTVYVYFTFILPFTSLQDDKVMYLTCKHLSVSDAIDIYQDSEIPDRHYTVCSHVSAAH